MMTALGSAALAVGGRIWRWLAATMALLGIFWISNRRAERRGKLAAERRSENQANRDLIERLRDRQTIDQEVRSGDSREELREWLRKQQEG